MALSFPLLQSQILKTFQQTLRDRSSIAQQLANAYRMYAQTAQGPVGDPVILKGIEQIKIRDAFQQILDHQIAPAPASQLIGIAVTQFWLLPPIQTALGGIVTSIVVVPGIANLSSINASSYAEAAQIMAQALDLMTKTVIINYSPTISAPGPLV